MLKLQSRSSLNFNLVEILKIWLTVNLQLKVEPIGTLHLSFGLFLDILDLLLFH